MEQVNNQRFDVEAQHAAEAIAIYKAVTGKGDAAYCRELDTGKWERAAIAASEIRRQPESEARATLAQIMAVAACFGEDWPDVPGEPEVLRCVKWAARQMQAARALPAPENVREGEPYDNPIFEDLARTMGVWGTTQASLCAQFFLAGCNSPPAPAKRYRLLERGIDTIQADDEFLRDADSSWQIDPQGIFVGMPYMSNVLLPARRAVEPDL